MLRYRTALFALAFLGAEALGHDWNGLAVSRAGDVFVVDADSSRIWKVAKDGQVTEFVSTKAGERMNHPHHLSLDASGSLWVGSG